jgi:hypothetical protein
MAKATAIRHNLKVAASSRPWSTFSIESRTARTRRGKAITAAATAAPFQLKAENIPNFS